MSESQREIDKFNSDQFENDFWASVIIGSFFLLIGIFFFLMVVIIPVSLTYIYNSHGEQTGNIYKLYKDGLFHTTYEGELVRGGLNNGNGSFGKSLDFTISPSNKLLWKEAQAAFQKQTPVIISYKHSWICSRWVSAQDCNFVTNIKEN